MNKLELPNTFNFTYKEKYLAEATFVLILLQGETQDGIPMYAYLGIKATVIEQLCQQINNGSLLDIAKYGKVFRCGSGENHSYADQQYMVDNYFWGSEKIHVGILLEKGDDSFSPESPEDREITEKQPIQRTISLEESVLMTNVSRITIGVISTQGIMLQDAISIVEKIKVIDTAQRELNVFGEPDEEKDE